MADKIAAFVFDYAFVDTSLVNLICQAFYKKIFLEK